MRLRQERAFLLLFFLFFPIFILLTCPALVYEKQHVGVILISLTVRRLALSVSLAGSSFPRNPKTNGSLGACVSPVMNISSSTSATLQKIDGWMDGWMDGLMTEWPKRLFCFLWSSFRLVVLALAGLLLSLFFF